MGGDGEGIGLCSLACIINMNCINELWINLRAFCAVGVYTCLNLDSEVVLTSVLLGEFVKSEFSGMLRGER